MELKQFRQQVMIRRFQCFDRPLHEPAEKIGQGMVTA